VTGDDRFRDLFLEIMPMRDGEWPRLDRSFFDAERLTRRLQRPLLRAAGTRRRSRVPESLRASLAAGIQRATEQTVIRMAGSGARQPLFRGRVGIERAAGLGARALARI
jgi:hypothetical protein